MCYDAVKSELESLGIFHIISDLQMGNWMLIMEHTYPMCDILLPTTPSVIKMNGIQ